MTVIAAGTNLEQVFEQAKMGTSLQGERFVLLRLPDEDVAAFEDYLDGLEADRIVRETAPSDWVAFSELTEYRKQAIQNGEVEVNE